MRNDELTVVEEGVIDYGSKAKEIGANFVRDCATDAKPKVEKLCTDFASLLYSRFLNWLNRKLSA